jgi:hypothetical protein
LNVFAGRIPPVKLRSWKPLGWLVRPEKLPTVQNADSVAGNALSSRDSDAAAYFKRLMAKAAPHQVQIVPADLLHPL